MTNFSELAELCEDLSSITSKLELADRIAQFLQKLPEGEVAPAVLLIVGQVFEKSSELTLDLGGASIWRVVHKLVGNAGDLGGKLTDAVDFGETIYKIMEHKGEKIGEKQLELSLSLPEEPLTILDVYSTFQNIAKVTGKSSRQRKEELLESVMRRATALENKYIVKALVGEMRHGVSEGIMLDAIAQAGGVSGELVRRANMCIGDIGEVAKVALREGSEGLSRISLQVFRPIKPMLAQVGDDVGQAFDEYDGKLALEYKLDGARVQIHKNDDEVRIFSRRLTEVTESLPEGVETVNKNLRAETAILEGEVIAVDQAGRPLPFQDLMQRFKRVHNVEEMVQQVPVKLYLFDILLKDGKSLIDACYEDRWKLLELAKGELLLVKRIIPKSLAAGEQFLKEAIREGHEGLMAKNLHSKYMPGRRGKLWLKIKPAETLDLVIVAADYGYGRRHGWLSNYHLAAWDEPSGEFLVVGKTFKGLTDEEFKEMTQRLLDLKVGQRGGTVFVKPEVVVEVLFNEVQRSPHYKSGFALRFARIARIRADKSPEEADNLGAIQRVYQRQLAAKGSSSYSGLK